MAIIIISRGSYSKGREVAERLAERLRYKTISREKIIDAASKGFNIPGMELIHAIEDAPSFWDKIVYTKKHQYILDIQAALLELAKADNLIYHGFAGHYFFREIPHVLKARINANMDIRARFVMERDNVTKEEAIERIKKIDELRRKWSQHFYGINTFTPELYDVVLRVDEMDVDNVVDLLCDIASSKSFTPAEETFKMIEDRLAEAKIKSALMDIKPDIEVSCKEGIVKIKTELPVEFDQKGFVDQVKEKCYSIKDVEINKVEFEILTKVIF